MKKLLLTLAIVASAAVSYGQGTIQFNNSTLQRFQVVTNGSGQAPVNAPASFAVNIGFFYAGPGTNSATLALSPTLGTMSATPGVMNAQAIYPLAGTEPNDTVTMLVRAWSSSFGSNWQAAQVAYLAGTPGVAYGETAQRNSDPLGATAGPGQVIWQGATGTATTKFTPLLINVNPVPEPTTIALGILGAGSLLFLRRKK